MMQKVMKTENRQVTMLCDMIIMLGGFHTEAAHFRLVGHAGLVPWVRLA